MKPSGPLVFLIEMAFNWKFTYLINIGLFLLEWALVICIFEGNCLAHVNCWIYWHRVVYNFLLTFFNICIESISGISDIIHFVLVIFFLISLARGIIDFLYYFPVFSFIDFHSDVISFLMFIIGLFFFFHFLKMKAESIGLNSFYFLCYKSHPSIIELCSTNFNMLYDFFIQFKTILIFLLWLSTLFSFKIF